MYGVENDVCLRRTVENNDCSRLYSDVKELDRGPQFTSGVSPIRNSMLGEQITVGQLTNKEGITMHIHIMMSRVRFNRALRQST